MASLVVAGVVTVAAHPTVSLISVDFSVTSNTR